MAGCRSLADVEKLTSEMSTAMRKLLGLRRRLPDTTARDLLLRISPGQLTEALQRTIRRAHRRHALKPVAFPWGVPSLDGKVTAIRAWDGQVAQQQGNKGMLRTITATLVSSTARVCVGANPIPADTNEMGAYVPALKELIEAYRSIDLFCVVMYDAGACSEANARATRELGVHYVMVLNAAQPTLHEEAQRVLTSGGGKVFGDVSAGVRYRVQRTPEMQNYLSWSHLRTVEKVEREVLDPPCQVVRRGERFFVSSLRPKALSLRGWLELTRARWGVENNTHHTFDAVFAEDDKPWIVPDPVGALKVILLRRIAYNLLAVYRSRTLRGEFTRGLPWRDLVRRIYNAIIAATDDVVRGIRPRHPPPLLAA